MRRRATVRPVYQRFASPTEKLVEFTFPDGRGGLISFRDVWVQEDGATVHRRIVDLYRLDDGITVLAPNDHARVYQTGMAGLPDASRVCKACGGRFVPSCGEYARCEECLGAQIAAAERAAGVQ